MNCKPGDLAMYVGKHTEHRGKVVRVVKQATLTDFEMARKVCDIYWEIAPELGKSWKCADVALRPIRDPGEDAKDETLQWKEVPTKQKEPA